MAQLIPFKPIMTRCKMKLGKLVQASGSLKKLLNADLPAREAYRLSRMATRMEEELTAVEKLRIDLVMKKYGTQKEDKTWFVPPEKLEVFHKEYNELLDVEVDIPTVKIKLEVLDDVKLSAVDLGNLSFLLEEEQEKKDASAVDQATPTK
jgi:GTP1/Obg family GTP-binding protein